MSVTELRRHEVETTTKRGGVEHGKKEKSCEESEEDYQAPQGREEGW